MGMGMGMGMDMATSMQSQQTVSQTDRQISKTTNKQASRQSGNDMTWGYVCMYVPSLGYLPCKTKKKKDAISFFFTLSLSPSLFFFVSLFL